MPESSIALLTPSRCCKASAQNWKIPQSPVRVPGSWPLCTHAGRNSKRRRAIWRDPTVDNRSPVAVNLDATLTDSPPRKANRAHFIESESPNSRCLSSSSRHLSCCSYTLKAQWYDIDSLWRSRL